MLVKYILKSLSEGSSDRLVTIRLHVVGGVDVEGAVAAHH